MKNSPSTRASLYALAGGYLIYLAYGFVKPLVRGENLEMAKWLTFLVTAVFSLAGIVLLISAIRMWKGSREEGSEEDEKNRDDENPGLK